MTVGGQGGVNAMLLEGVHEAVQVVLGVVLLLVPQLSQVVQYRFHGGLP